MNVQLQSVGYSHTGVRLVRQLVQHKTVGNLFVVEGTWGCEKLLSAQIVVRMVLVCEARLRNERERRLAEIMIEKAQSAYAISEKLCDQISDRDASAGCFIVCEYPVHELESLVWGEDALVVVLDGLEKPGNIGTIIRSAEGAGGQAVLVTHRHVALTHHRLIRASLGAAWTMPVLEVGYERLVRYLAAERFTVILTDLTAERPYYAEDYRGRVAIVAGNEIRGVSKEWREAEGLRVQPVIIPMFGECESLNVGFATTMVAYAAGLQQRGLLKYP